MPDERSSSDTRSRQRAGRSPDTEGVGHSEYDAESLDSHGPGRSSIHHTARHDALRRRSSGVGPSALKWRRVASPQRVEGSHPKASWKPSLRSWNDDDEPTWWFASTAIPLLAATLGPLANVLSIAALVTYWRMCLVRGVNEKGASECAWDSLSASLVPELNGQEFADPRWCYNLNIVSLVFGFVGNFFLLCNFTNRIRYVVALPGTIICWFAATGILIGITASMQMYAPPTRPQQTYTQGFWYAILAATSYLICAAGLMVNMLGFWLGHYPHRFTLTDSQRTLILQTMMFFVWLAAGGAIFSAVERGPGTETDDESDGTESAKWSFVNALYFSDVTILTVGFGDFYPQSNVGRGLVFPYSVGGIVVLGLMITSITAFVRELGTENVVKGHKERTRARTIDRTAKTSLELECMRTADNTGQTTISTNSDAGNSSLPHRLGSDDGSQGGACDDSRQHYSKTAVRRATTWAPHRRVFPSRPSRLVLLRAEKDRFEAMRRIQRSTSRFKKWYGLLMSVLAFGFLWCIGAVVFWQAEKSTANEMTYFKALYFGYVSLLTIGYGDLAPKSNAGRPFFVFWSLIAVPTMTILVGDLSDTIVRQFKQGTSGIADFTVLPQKGIWRGLLHRQPRVVAFMQARKDRKQLEERQRGGLPYGPEPENGIPQPTIDELASEDTTRAELAQRLANSIKQVSQDTRKGKEKKYTYEEWVEFTRLIRFTADKEENELAEDDDLVEWDWLGDKSPMMANKSEAEFVLERLSESVSRYVRRVEKALASNEEQQKDRVSLSDSSRDTKQDSPSHPNEATNTI
ncbi:hypothetical protein CKM354_000015900 [Cercospora kikuchii]|uniref:Potassium channel domain-containing protein n=1 Tax=Cercospora kikuchii TaxID=84275 RepID=A0A9P3F6Z3_9PEZI|nr:uncharacterized protein CKM354_000015900 [Cercospora kikuchii]GIZ36691.1 hypothetical protein CKM354_000015900 [Cercospora kikuchii]